MVQRKRKLILMLFAWLSSALPVVGYAQTLHGELSDAGSMHTYAVSDTSATMNAASLMEWGSYTRTTLDGHIPPLSTHLETTPFVISLGLYSSAVLALHYYQLHAWWSNDRGPFHFQEDWPIELQVDKFGHFYGGYMMSYANREALLECGFSDDAAHNWGAALGLTYQLYVEVEDGFSTKWGFSPSDAYADIAGAGYFFMQKQFPVLQNFHEKWTYAPSAFLGKGNIAGQQRTFIDDYEGQSYWWTVDVWNLLSDNAKQHYPNWLQLAVGYSAKHDGSKPSDVPDTREIFIGLDYNIMHIIPKTGSPFVNWIVQTCDNLHFPAPAIQVNPNVHFFIFYPFKFHVGGANF